MERVDAIIKRLEDDQIKGVKITNDLLKTALAKEQEDIKESLGCTGHYPKIAERLIDSLQHAAEMVVSKGMKSHTSHSIYHAGTYPQIVDVLSACMT